MGDEIIDKFTKKGEEKKVEVTSNDNQDAHGMDVEGSILDKSSTSVNPHTHDQEKCPLTFDNLKDATSNSALLDGNWKCRKCGRLAADHSKTGSEKKDQGILSYPILSYPILSYPILSYSQNSAGKDVESILKRFRDEFEEKLESRLEKKGITSFRLINLVSASPYQ